MGTHTRMSSNFSSLHRTQVLQGDICKGIIFGGVWKKILILTLIPIHILLLILILIFIILLVLTLIFILIFLLVLILMFIILLVPILAGHCTSMSECVVRYNSCLYSMCLSGGGFDCLLIVLF